MPSASGSRSSSKCNVPLAMSPNTASNVSIASTQQRLCAAARATTCSMRARPSSARWQAASGALLRELQRRSAGCAITTLSPGSQDRPRPACSNRGGLCRRDGTVPPRDVPGPYSDRQGVPCTRARPAAAAEARRSAFAKERRPRPRRPARSRPSCLCAVCATW